MLAYQKCTLVGTPRSETDNMKVDYKVSDESLVQGRDKNQNYTRVWLPRQLNIIYH
jgi:hypothetical protein